MVGVFLKCQRVKEAEKVRESKVAAILFGQRNLGGNGKLCVCVMASGINDVKWITESHAGEVYQWQPAINTGGNLHFQSH